MSAHVPHVCDAWSGLTALNGGVDDAVGCPFFIPEMDAVMVRWMRGVSREHLIKKGLVGLSADRGDAFARIQPELVHEQGFRFGVVGELVDEFFCVSDPSFPARDVFFFGDGFLLVRLLGFVLGRRLVCGCRFVHCIEASQRFNVVAFVNAGLGPPSPRLMSKFCRTVFGVWIGHGHSPVGHGTVRIDGRGLTE